MFRLVLSLALAASISSSAGAAGARRQVNEEYGLAVTFPADTHPCVADSGGHAHGFYVRLDGARAACERNGRTRWMAVYADYNALFARSARAAIADHCDQDSPAPPAIARAARGLRFPQGVSESCARTRGSTIVITVMAQGGHWPPPSDPSERRTAWINYGAWVETDPEHLDRDLARFRAMLSGSALRRH